MVSVLKEKLQYVKDKITKDSWAYQTSNKLSVTNTYPANRADRVLTSSNIEIEMSYSNIENFEKYVQIVPEVEGTWEQKGKVYRFIPSNGLVDQTQYTVTVKKGLKIYDQELEDNYTFSFSVNNDTGITEIYENISNSIDNINTYNSNENISLYYQTNGNSEITNVEIGKFDSSDSFIEYLQTKDYSKATDLQKVDFNLIENGIRLTRTLQDGYYVDFLIKNKNDSELFNTPIQINNLNAYVTNTENDILVWVADENGIASNIKVITGNPEEFSPVRRRLYDDWGLAMTVTENVNEAGGCTFVIAPRTDKSNPDGGCLLYRNEYSGSTVCLSGSGVTLPDDITKVLPPCNSLLFASALYELCGATRLSELCFDRLADSSSKGRIE